MKKLIIVSFLFASCAAGAQIKKPKPPSQLPVITNITDSTRITASQDKASKALRLDALRNWILQQNANVQDSIFALMAAMQAIVDNKKDINPDIPDFTAAYEASLQDLINRPEVHPADFIKKDSVIYSDQLPLALLGRIQWVEANTGSATFSNMGSTTPVTVGGTLTSASFSTTTLRGRMKRVNVVGAATAGSIVGLKQGGGTSLWRGDSAGRGGFYCLMNHSVSVVTTDALFFAGFKNNNTNPTATAAPSSYTSMFGFGRDAADANMQIMHNDASGTATKIDTGIPFTIETIYRFEFTVLPGGGGITLKLTSLATGASFSSTLSTNLPANTDELTWFTTLSNNATAAAVTLGFSRVWIQSFEAN